VDEDLRSAVDGLIARGGRVVVRSGDPEDRSASAVTLDQPGARFGILEIYGRVALDGADRDRAQSLTRIGWADPHVTSRGGREIRIRPAGVDGEALILARTWRVPPALASEIVADVRVAIGTIGAVEATPLAARSAPSDRPAVTGTSDVPLRAEIDQAFDRSSGSSDPARMRGRSVPAPLRALTLVVLTVIVAVGWTAIIRDTGRSSAARSGPPASAGALTDGSGSTPSTSANVSSIVPTDVPPSIQGGLAAQATDASSQRAGSGMSSATDGDLATAWRPEAGSPQWIELRLDPVATINAFELVITQSASGSATHVIEIAGPDGPLRVVGTVERFTDDGEHISVRPPTPIDRVERVRIETIGGPPDVGWYEVIVR
jgi:hypothetical protein